jgi:hypothetical protein
VQCKALSRVANPGHIRELEGAFNAVPTEWQKEKDALGFFATTNGATRGVIDALRRSKFPLGFLDISAGGTIKQFLWNHAATDRGILQGLGVVSRYRLDEDKCVNKINRKDVTKDIILSFKGNPLPQTGLDSPQTVC